MNRPGTLATLRVNGVERPVTSPPGRRLCEVLREELRLQGTKVGCDAGECGACTVLLDGAPVCACLTPLAQALGRAITTVEGLAADGLSRLQAAFLRHGAAQCGICTPGMLMAASALLAVTPRPSRAEAEAVPAGVRASHAAARVAALDLGAFPIVWHPCAPVTDPAEAATARPIHPDRPGNLLTAGRVVTGEARAALAASAHVVGGAVETGFVEHAHIEPRRAGPSLRPTARW